MKKFMIFLLMAFLYLGTCQARSEASHPNDGKLKLLSWVSPTPSQSFLTRSVASDVDLLGVQATAYSVHIEGAHASCPGDQITLTAVIDGPVTSDSLPTYVWKIDGNLAPGVNNQSTYQFIPESILDNLPHEFTVEVTMKNCEKAISPVHMFQKVKVVPVVTGPAFACENATSVELVAQIDAYLSALPSPATVAYWRWYKGGESSPYATTTENTLSLPMSVVGTYNWSAIPVLEAGLECVPTPHNVWNASSIQKISHNGGLTLGFDGTTTTPLCAGSQFVLKVTSDVAGVNVTLANPTYKWYMDGNLVGTTTSETFATSVTEGTHSFYVEAIYDNYDCNEIKSDAFAVEATAAPELAILGDNVICAGQTTNTLTASTGFDTYTWTKPDASTSTGATVNAILPGVYHLKATTAAGCTATADFNVYQFGSDLQLSASEYYVCPGEVVVLNANLNGWTNENITYTWTKPDATTFTGSTLVTTFPASATSDQVYKVKATAAAGCEHVDSIIIHRIAPTTATFTVSVSKQKVCEGQQVKAVATVTGTYDGLYTWYVNGVEVPGENNDTITMNMNQAGTYTFAVTPANTVCSNIGLSAVTTNNTVQVDALPELAITGNDVICYGQETTLYATTGFASWSWTKPDGTNASTANITTSLPGAYHLTATTTEGCKADADLTVTQLGGDLQLTASEVNVCPSAYVMLNANLDGFGNQVVTYTWNDGSANIGNGSSMPVQLGTSSTTYHVTATAGSCIVVDSIKVNVINTAANPLVVTVTSDPKICVGGTLTATATATGVEFITWYVNGVEVPGQNLTTLNLNLFQPGTYTVSAKPAYDPCNAYSPKQAHTTVTVYEAPTVSIAGENTICSGASTTLHGIVVPTSNDLTYSWTKPDGNHASDSALTTNLPGVYTLKVTDTATTCFAVAEFTVYQLGGDLQLTANQTYVCAGDPVVLNANLDGFGNENVTYTWSQVGGSSLGAGSTITVYPTADTKYAVKATAGDCEMNDTINIKVSPAVNYTNTTVTNPNGNYNFCEGQQSYYFVATSQPSTADNYVWYLDGIEIPGQNLSTIELSALPIGSHWIAAKPVAASCDTVKVSDDVPFKVHANPTITLSGNNVICVGDTAHITAAAATLAVHPASSTVYTYTYNWSNNPSTNDPVLTASVGGLYTVTVTDQFGCYAAAGTEVKTMGGMLEMTADKMTVCEGESVVLKAISTGYANESATYSWSVSGHNGETTITVMPTTTNHTYAVSVTAGTCQLTASININVIAVDTITTNIVYANTTKTSDTVCQGTQVTVSATSTNVGGNPVQPQYIWYVDGFEVPGESLNYLTMTLTPGHHTFKAKAVVENCVVAKMSNEVSLLVDPTPDVTILGEHFYTVGSNNPAVLVATINPTGVYTYQWNNGDTTESINVSNYGVYQVTATSANGGCVGISEPFTVSAVVDIQTHIEGATAACQHDVVTLSAIVDNDLEGHEYAWLVNNQYIFDTNGIEGAKTAHLKFPVDSLYNYYGQLLANEFTVEISRPGCDHPVISPVHPFLISPIPYVQVVAPEKVCAGHGVTLEAVVYQIGDNAQYQYVWYQDGTPVDTIDYVNTYDVAADQIAGHNYAVQVIYQDIACNSDISEAVTIPFYVAPTPITLSIQDSTTICTSNQATLVIADANIDSVNFGEAVYTWYMNGIELPLVHGTLFTADFDHNGEYTFWATASYANYPCALNYTDTVSETVVMHPTIMITGDPIICHDNDVNLYAVLNDTVSSMEYTYEWRLYNYTLDWGIDSYVLGSYWWDLALDSINNGNTIYYSYADNDPWLEVAGLGAQDNPYIFTAIVTTPQGCRVESEPYLVYVGDSIHVVATVDYDSVCAEGMITATAHLGNWNMDNLTAQWEVSTDNGATWEPISYGTSGILQHVPGVTSLYRIHVTQTTTGCEAYSNEVLVTVFQPASINHIIAINHDDAYPTDNVCEGAQLDVTAYLAQLDSLGNPVIDSITAAGDTVYKYYVDHNLHYMWELNGMQLQSIHGPEFSAQAYIYDGDPVDYTYTAYIVYDIPGCNLIPVASNTIHVKRNPVVVIDGNPNVCFKGIADLNIGLTAWVDGDVDLDATYTWYESGQYRQNTNGTDNEYHENYPPSYDNPYIFTVEVTNGDGCTTMSDPFYVNVYDIPYTNITADASEICLGGNVTLRANLDNYNDPMLVYQWYKDDVDNTHIIPGATHEIETFEPTLGFTDYIVAITHLMSYGDEVCVAYDTFTVNVNAIPEVSAAYFDLNSQSICEGKSFNIAASVVSGGVTGGEVYTWYRNGQVMEGFHGDTLNDAPVAIDNEPTVYTYAVSVKQSASGCESEIFTLTPSITVNPNPALELVTDPIVCAEDSNNVVLYANVTPMPATTVNYKWMEDNAVVAITPDSVYYFTKAYRDYPYSFSVELVNDYGCVSHADAQVYVNAAPIVNITATETNICKGGEITLSASLNDWNADMLTYQWYDGATLIDGATSLNYTVIPDSGTHKYNIHIDQLTSLCHAGSDTVTVEVNADPTIVINYAANQYTVCDGYQVDLTTTVTGGVDGDNVYTWYRNGQVIEGANSSTYSEIVSALNGEITTYIYAVSVAQHAAGCESNVYTLNTITVNPNPVVVLVTDPIVCDTTGNNIILTANMNPDTVGSTVTFKWMEDNAVMNASDYTVLANNKIALHKDYQDYPYSFAVQVVNDYACSSTSEAQVYVNAAPIVNITATETDICEGGEITLTASLNDWNADMLTFQWYDGATMIDGATSLSYTVVPTVGTHKYNIQIDQLTSLCHAASDTVTVTVNAIPVIASVTASQYTVCNGAQLEITATPADGYQPGEVYTWFRNGILIPGAVTATILDAPNTVDNNIQHYTYTAVVTRPQAGCTSDITVATASSNVVTVYPNPVVVITGDQHVCETDSIFLIANVDTTAFAVGNLHYTWYESGQLRDNMAYGLGDNSFYAEYFYARTEPYVFTVNVERNDIEAGCAALSAEYYVYVYPQPVVNITVSEPQICTNGEVTLTANLNDYNAENLVYQWYEVRYHDVTYAVSYDSTDDYVYTTVTEPYRYYIPGATMPVYTTTLGETTTLGVTVFQTNSTCWSNDEVEIIVNPVPVVTAVNVSENTVCNGAQVTVTATINANGTDATGAVYTWYRNGILIEGANGASFSENVFTTDNHVTVNTYTAIVTLQPSGCVSAMSPAATVTINPAPTTVTISGISTICENDSTLLTAYSDVQGEFTWSTGSHDSNIYVNAGTYTVTMKTAEGCEMTSQPFTVTAFGSDLIVSASATSICRGEHTTLYADQEGWQGNVTYAWDAQAGNSTAATVDVQPDSTTTYHVTATVSSTNGSCSVEGVVTIIVNQLPADFAVTASTNTICQGQQITFTAPVDPQVTGYIWYQNGIEIAGENQNEITVNFNEAGDYTFAAKAISLEGCVSAHASAPVTVTVTPAPTTVTITGINVLCQNDSTTLTAHSDVPGTFTWNDGTVGATNVVTEGVYNVTIETAEGCHMTSENFTVESFGTDLIVSASATSICQGDHTTLYVDQAGWQGNVTYAWDAQAGNSHASTVDVQPNATTTYHVTATVTSNNGSCTAEGEVTIVVNPLPVITNVTASETTICPGQQVTFTATGDANTTAYIWYANGVEIEGENQATLTVNFNEPGTYNYAVKAISNENCIAAVAYNAPVVTVKHGPTTVTITGINVLCQNDSTTLTAHSDVPGTFTWNDGTTGATKVVTEGVYNVTIETAEGCHMTSENFTVESFGTDLIVSASATSICQGDHTTLYVDQAGWQGNVTYAWDAQANNSHASTVDVQPNATTTYHVTATVTSNNGSCTAEGEVTIVVNPLPVITNVTASETTICPGQQVTFTATGDANTTAYIWYANGVEIEGENQATLTVNFNEAGTYNYAVKAISNENCIAAVAYNAPVVTVKHGPTTVTITGINVLCQNDSTTLTAHSDVPGTFTWNDGTTGPTKVVTEGVYNVTIETAEGCHMTSENFTVQSFGTDVIVSASATSICQGEHTTLYVDQAGWQGNVTYAWDAQAGNSHATTVDVQPMANTTYHVTATVSTNNGSCTAVGEITILVNPLPVVSGVTATQTVVCEGTQVTFTANGDANTTAYIWYNNGVEIAGENQATLTVNFNEAGVYSYAVKVISNEGCVSAIAVDAPAVTVNAAPQSVTVSGNTVICNGGSTTLFANVVPNLPATYQWFKDNVNINTNTDTLYVTESGSYKVVASFNGCSTESDAVVVTVEQTPQLQLTATEEVICVNGTTVITAEATGWNNSNVIYTWSNNFQGSAFTFTPTVAGIDTFTVTASQATSGCVAEASIIITVNAIPATPVVTVDNAIVCDGGQVTLTVTNADANATYTWMRNGVVINGAHGATLTESPVTVDGDATNYVYTVVAELPMSGCTSATSANTVVTVIPTPVVYVAVEGNTTICAGGSTILHANVTPAGSGYTYQWYKDNVLISGATSADYTAAELARETAYNYTVVVTANAGCNVTANAPAITFVADPVVAAIISNDSSCVGGTATLTAIVDGGVANVNGLNGYTYEWFRNMPNSTTSSLVGNNATFTTPATDAPGNYTYWVTVTSNYGCQSTSPVVAYTVVADPVVTIVVANGYPQNVCEGGESMLKANVTGGNGTATYQWYKNGNLLVGETNQTLSLFNLQAGAADNYTVEVIQSGVGCANSASANLNTLVTVAPAYTVNITGFGNVCEGGDLTLTATVSGVLAGDVLTYQWYKILNGEDYAIAGANAATYTTSDLLLGNSYEYFVVVNSTISGCSTVSSTVPANVVAAPTVAIQGANTVCEGGTLTLNAFVNGGVDGAAYTYTWNWTGAATGSSTTAVPTFAPNVTANDLATPYYFTVTITRNDNTGCTATSEAHEVNVLAVPTVSVTADNNYICQNGQVTFTAHVSPVGAYNYVWTINGQQQAVNAATVTTTQATTGTINASVVVSAANASASCSATASIATPVQVVAVPTVTLAANHTTMCVGGVTTLTATVNANANIPSNFNYEWIVDGTPVPGVTNTLNQTLNEAGVHTYQVRVSQDNTLGCASTWSNQATVQVAEQPVVTLTSEDGLSICEGGSINLTGIVTNYGNSVNGVTNSTIYGNLTFDWTSNGVNVHHNTPITIASNQVTETLNTVGNYTYQVTVTPTGYNCQPQISNEYTVEVVGNPSWTDVHVYSNNGTDACLGEMVYLYAGIQGGTVDGVGSTSGHIQWVVTDAAGNTVNVDGGLGGTSYDTPDQAGTYIYTPTFLGNIGNGCQLTNTAAVQVAVTVHDLPTANFTSGDGTSLCANDPSASAQLVITFTGVAPFTYEVVDAAGNVIAHATTMANTATIYVAPEHQTTYRINLIGDNYCENPAVGNDITATVYVNDIQFTENMFVSGCSDNGNVTVTFNMISGNPTAAFTVVYDNGSTYTGTISNNSATFAAPAAPGDYNAVLTIDGCDYNIVVRVLVSDLGFGGSLPIMDQRWTDVVVVNNNPATNGGHTFVGFQWYHNGVAIPGATYSNYQEKGGLNGFYAVELIEKDANGNLVTYMTCDMYFSGNSAVKVYPVPANVRQEITIELDLTSEELEGAVLDIYSVTGAHISHVTDLQPITKIEGFTAQGTYFGRILTGTNEIKTVKFIVVK